MADRQSGWAFCPPELLVHGAGVLPSPPEWLRVDAEGDTVTRPWHVLADDR